MTFATWIGPLLDYYKDEADIFTHHIARSHDGRFELRDIKGAMAKGIGWRHLYRVRNRLNKLATIYETLVVKRVIE
jgi:hypothetical protein